MTEQKAVLARLRRRAGASEAVRERLREYNKGQTYHGRCRICGSTWTGTLASVPENCPSCGHPNGA